LAAPIAARHRLAVVAVGGYGRRRLCPASDIDLFLLHDRLEAPALEAAVRGIVYPLWDAGLTVGYAVRDRREALSALDDVATATAMLDARTLAGDHAFAQRVHGEALRRLRRRSHHFLAGLRAADHGRRAKAGSAAEVIEPDLKNGAGGVRDVQSLRWAAAALVGASGLDLDPLVSAGYLGASDRSRLAHAEDRLLAARVTLHLVDDTTDVVRLDLQDEVAGRLGFVDGDAHDLASHRLLTELTLAARTIDHVHRRAWTLIDADLERGTRRRGRPTEAAVDGFELVDGVLRLPADLDLDHPELPGRILVALADTGAVLDRGSTSRLRSRVDAGDVRWRWTERERERFLAVLWRGHVGLPAVAEWDDVGLLTAVLPAWAPLRGRPQRNPFHRYCLDRHAWHAAAHLGDLARREPWAQQTLEEVDDRDGLMLGVLLHDVGKAVGEPHSRTGVPLARQLAEQMGAAPDTVDLVGRLVELHLLLPDTARTRDITDPDLAAEIAARIGDRSTLACLHLLAAADGRATGPSVWSDWIASLIATLVTKVRAVLDEQHPDDVSAEQGHASYADGAGVTVHEAQRLAPELGASSEAVRDHLARLPTRYANAVSARAVVRHTSMCARHPAASEVHTRVTPGEDVPEGLDGIDELDVVARDHPGWFATVAGVVTLHAGSIVAADGFTRADQLAIQTFKVRAPEGAAGSWWAAVEGDLAEAAAGRLAVRARVARRARADGRRVARLRQVQTELTTELTAERDASGRATVVEVRTLDRLGVLYAIATALAELHLDILVARIQTFGHEVVDVFTVRDADGRPLDRDHIGELELAVTAAIEAL
jgi:[protein-PII] uridylyltransferase